MIEQTGNSPDDRDRLEAWVRRAAREFPYPPTPNLAPRARAARAPRLRLAYAVAIVLALLAGLLAVPQVRAGLVEFLQIGVIRIFLTEPSATPTQAGQTPQPTPTLLPSLLQLAGRNTLEEARARAPFPIRLPSHPADLGQPDHVFLQDLDGAAVVLVWIHDERPERVRLSLHLLVSDAVVKKGIKGPVETIAFTEVNGQEAIVAEGPYILQMQNGNWDFRRLVEGRVLIWTEGDVTYRLESDLPLEEMVLIAESLR